MAKGSKSNNGWVEWKDLQGNSIEKYRDKDKLSIIENNMRYVYAKFKSKRI